MKNLQELRTEFIGYRITPTEWLGDSPSRFDQYTNLAKDCDEILELGVYSGLTSVAFLLALPKKLISIDITDTYFNVKDEVSNAANKLHIDYKFLIMNDLEYESHGQDLLFIDTSHTYEHTLLELKHFGQLTRKKIILHDVSSFIGVYRAVFEWLWANKNFYISFHDTRGDGLIVLDRHVGV